jgi:formylmethanofuran dehydrogenase subunit D
VISDSKIIDNKVEEKPVEASGQVQRSRFFKPREQKEQPNNFGYMPSVIKEQQANKVDVPITQQSASPVHKTISITTEKEKEENRPIMMKPLQRRSIIEDKPDDRIQHK